MPLMLATLKVKKEDDESTPIGITFIFAFEYRNEILLRVIEHWYICICLGVQSDLSKCYLKRNPSFSIFSKCFRACLWLGWVAILIGFPKNLNLLEMDSESISYDLFIGLYFSKGGSESISESPEKFDEPEDNPETPGRPAWHALLLSRDVLGLHIYEPNG